MGRKYTVAFDGVAVSAAQDLWEFTAATNKPIRLLGWSLANVGGTADAGDAQEELLRLIVSRGAFSTGTGGTSPTPAPVEPYDTAAGFTAEANNTTIGTNTASVTLFTHGFNVRIPDIVFLPEELQVQTDATTGRLCLRLQTAPADAVTMSGTAFVEEL